MHNWMLGINSKMCHTNLWVEYSYQQILKMTRKQIFHSEEPALFWIHDNNLWKAFLNGVNMILFHYQAFTPTISRNKSAGFTFPWYWSRDLKNNIKWFQIWSFNSDIKLWSISIKNSNSLLPPLIFHGQVCSQVGNNVASAAAKMKLRGRQSLMLLCEWILWTWPGEPGGWNKWCFTEFESW